MRFLIVGFAALLSLAAPCVAATCEAIGNTAPAFAEANTYRARAGVGPLKESPALRKAAQTFACDMARRGYFSHHSPEGQGVTGRTGSVGFRGRCVGENIARGLGIVQSPTAVMRSWEASPGHRQQLVAARYDIAGFAGVKVGKNAYWVMMFGGCTGSIFETFP